MNTLKKTLLLFGLMFGLTFNTLAQNQQVTMIVVRNAEQQSSYLMSDTDRLYFISDTILMIESQGNISQITLSEIQKIYFDVQTSLDQQKTLLSPSMFPNPATDEVVISNFEGLQQIAIFALDGHLMKSVLSDDIVHVNLQGFPAGVYVVKVGDKNLKLIKL